MYKLAVLTTHPIQYQAPLWRILAADPNIDLTVFFETDFGIAKPGYDPEFGQEIKWDVPLLDGYTHKFLKGASELIKDIRGKKFDALLIHNWNHSLSWRAVFAAHHAGVKVLLRAESPWVQEAEKPFWKKALKQLALRVFFAKVDAFLCIGEENKEFYRHFGAEDKDLFFVPYAIDNERFAKAAADFMPRREEFRASIGILPQTTAFLFAGKMIPKKNPMDILEGYSRIASENTHLVVVGDGALRAQFEEAASARKIPNVLVAGFKNQKEMPSWYAAADCFILYSGEGETWGLGINEAMACGLPVITSDMVGSARDLVREGENGYIVPLKDPEKLANAMRAMLDPQRRAVFSKRSAEMIRAYSFEADRAGILEALKHILPR